MSAADCEISFKDLTLIFSDEQLPLIKATDKSSRHVLVATWTLWIKLQSVALVKCKILNRNLGNKKHRSQVYISRSGIVHPPLKCVTSGSGFYNSKRGILKVLVCT
jgi:hypothetical protein